jgi:hypothetical protein
MPKGVYKREVATVLARFMSRVGPPTAAGCREWLGPLSHGYGYIDCGGVRYGAHVASAIAYYGQIPDGKETCHHCDNCLCVNPGHLYFGTRQQNVNDAISRGRFRTRKHPKITLDLLVAIRKMPQSETGRSIAIRYKISEATVSMIRNGQWPRTSRRQA